MRLIGFIKRLVGRANYIDAIADSVSKADIPDGYSGGSLANDNILIVSNVPLLEQDVDVVFKKEMADYAILSTDQNINRDAINNASSNLVGPFTHIINVVYDKEQWH